VTGWEAPARRRSPRGIGAIAGALLLVVVAGLWLRPTESDDPDEAGELVVAPELDAELDAETDGLDDPVGIGDPDEGTGEAGVGGPGSIEQPDGPADADGAVPARHLRIHSFAPATLTPRAPALSVDVGLDLVRTAVSPSGRLVVVGREQVSEEVARLELLHADDLRRVAVIERVAAPVLLLSVTPDDAAIAWIQPGRGTDEADRIHRLDIADGLVAAVDGPVDLQVRDLRALSGGRVAIMGRFGTVDADTGAALVGTRVVVLDVIVGRVVLDVTVADVGVVEGEPPEVLGGQPATVWDVERERLHLVRAVDAHLVTIDLTDREAMVDPPPVEAPESGVVQLFQRTAVLDPAGERLIVSGTLDRHVGGTMGVRRFATQPLAPMVLSVASGEELARGEAVGTRIITAGSDVAVFELRDRGAARVQVVDAARLRPLGVSILLPGRLRAAVLDEREEHVTLAVQHAGGVALHRAAVDGSGLGPASLELDGRSEVHLDVGVAFERTPVER
jgi:hypothetical protein